MISEIISILILHGLDEMALTLYRLSWPAIDHSEIFLWFKQHFKTSYYRLLTIQELVSEL